MLCLCALIQQERNVLDFLLRFLHLSNFAVVQVQLVNVFSDLLVLAQRECEGVPTAYARDNSIGLFQVLQMLRSWFIDVATVSQLAFLVLSPGVDLLILCKSHPKVLSQAH